MSEKLLNLPRPSQTETIELYVNAWKKIRTELADSIRKISMTDFIQPMPNGSWSAAEITEHLIKSQCHFARIIPLVIRGRIGKKRTGPPTDFKLIEDYFINHQRINNPKSVSPVHIQKRDEALQSLEKSMKSFCDQINLMPEELLHTVTVEHFIFGHLNTMEFTWVLTMHENHHSYLLRKKYNL